MLADVQPISFSSTPDRAGVLPQGDGVSREQPRHLAPLEEHNDHVRIPSHSYCGQGAIVGCSSDRSHVLIIPIYCKAWDCPHCGPRRKALVVKSFIAGKPTKEIVLTTPPTPNESPKETALRMKTAWRQLVAMIRKRFRTFEYALTFELTKKNRPHMHVLCRGEYIPKKWLSIRWTKLGFGSVVHIQKIKSTRLSALHLAKYLVKHADRSAAAFAPLHIIQFSKNYLPRDFRTPHLKQFVFYSWTFTRSSPAEIIKDFTSSKRHLFTLNDRADLTEIYLQPSRCHPSDYEVSADWILAPHAPADAPREHFVYNSELRTFEENLNMATAALGDLPSWAHPSHLPRGGHLTPHDTREHASATLRVAPLP